MSKRIFILGAILSVVMLVGLAGCTSAEFQTLQGTLKNVDSVSGNVTVTMKDGNTQTFNFTDVKVDTIKQAMGNATLEIGDQVTVRVHKNGDVKKVDVENAEVHGIIKSLGTDSVTITTKKQGDITLKVTPETKIRIENKGTAAFTDLKIGQAIEVKYAVASQNALRINGNMGEDNGKGEIEGVVKAIDTTNKTVTITSKANNEVILKITAETAIRIENQRTAAISDIVVGQHIEAKYDKSNLNALKLAIEIEADEDEEEEEDD